MVKQKSSGAALANLMISKYNANPNVNFISQNSDLAFDELMEASQLLENWGISNNIMLENIGFTAKGLELVF